MMVMIMLAMLMIAGTTIVGTFIYEFGSEIFRTILLLMPYEHTSEDRGHKSCHRAYHGECRT